MTSLIAIVSKQVQLQELVACIEHFAVDDVHLHLFNHQGRISPAGVRATLSEICRALPIQLKQLEQLDVEGVGFG